MDTVSKEKRSEIMSKIRGKDTKPELLVRRELSKRKIFFRKNYKALPGMPDVYIPRTKAVIMVQGCFWHCHEGCSKARRPKSNVEFWDKKLNRNVERDGEHRRLYESMGLRVAVLWECELKAFLADVDGWLDTNVGIPRPDVMA